MAEFKDVKLNFDSEERTKFPGNHDVDRLDDNHEDEFKGATLALASEGKPAVASAQVVVENVRENSPNENDALTSGAGMDGLGNSDGPPPMSHRTLPARGFTAEDIREFFANGALDNAAQQCQPVILENLDGALQGVWLLTEIDHWDTEKERLVFLTDYSVVLLKYDFITLKLLEYRRLHLKDFDKVIVGELKYPENSLMPARNQIGVRCMWNQDQPLTFLKNWNPWSREIPYVTFTSHPLAKQEGTSGTKYDIENFSNLLVQTVERLDITKAPPHNTLTALKTCSVHYQPVVVDNYAGILSAFHNANDFGFFKSRGKVSF